MDSLVNNFQTMSSNPLQQEVICIDDEEEVKGVKSVATTDITPKEGSTKEIIATEAPKPSNEIKLESFDFKQVKKESKFKIEPVDIGKHPVKEDPIYEKIRKQIEFYFSDSNLPYDRFMQSLERKDDDGCRFLTT